MLVCATAFISAPVYAQAVSVTYETLPPEDIQQFITENLPVGDTAKTALQARRQARRAKTVVADTLNSFGYYTPTITVSVGETDGRPVSNLTVDIGPLFTLDRAELKYTAPAPRPEDAAKLSETLPVKSGALAIPAEIIDAQRVLGKDLRDMGYAFSEVEGRDVIGDQDAATISVRYNINSGPRVVFGDVIYPDDIKTKSAYLAKLNPTRQGAVYNPADLALFNSRLAETRLFELGLARLSTDPVSETAEGDAVYDVVLEIEERPRNTIALGGNFGTNEGFGVNAELTRRNATRRGDLMIAEARLAEREYGVNFVWRRPNEFGYGKGLILTGEVKDENTDAFEQQSAKIGAGYEVVRGPRLNFNYGVSGQYIRETEFDAAETDRDFQTVSAYAGVAIDQSDSLLDPRKGWRAEGRIVPTYAFGGEDDQPYARAVAQGRVYYPIDDEARLVIAGRLRAGTLLGAQTDNVPSESRFYAGGGGSVRGYAYQGIGPFDEDDIPQGGRSLLDGSLEARWRYNDKIGVVGFFDAGDVSDEQYPTFDNLRAGVGVGARYMTPAGPLRVDLAMPLDPSDRDEDFQLYISIGQAF